MDKVNAPQDMSSPASSYASVTQKENFPMIKHAIVLDSYKDITIKDYILGVGKALNPTNIRFASRIANNRICISQAKLLLTISHPIIQIYSLKTDWFL